MELSKTSRVAITTDSNSSITQVEAKALGITVLPVPFFINEQLYLEDVTLTADAFYKFLDDDSVDMKTTQPTPADVMRLWEEALIEYDEVVYIPMSSGLSSSCATALALAEEFEGKVHVVDNQRISLTQRQSVLDAIMMANAGKSGAEIKQILEDTKFDSDIYITLDTLKYLKKGGRLTPAAAAIGTVLNLKPILRIKGEKLDAFAKVRGLKAAKRKMIETVKQIIEVDFPECHGPQDLYVQAAYTGTPEEGIEWQQELEEAFPEYKIDILPLSLCIACHTGAGAKGIGVTKALHLD